MVQALSMAGEPKVLQRCWAHQIREVDVFVEKPGGKELSEAFYEKFMALKGFLSEVPLASMEKWKQQKEVWDKMAELVAKQFASSRN